MRDDSPETLPPSIACPLVWSRVLRRNAAPPKARERGAVAAWLAHHGWRQEAGMPHWWIDPLDRADLSPLDEAMNRQSLRDAQRVLEALGWEMTGGCRGAHRVWTLVHEVRKVGTRHGYVTPSRALRIEGLEMPPALERVHFAPELRLIVGGRGSPPR